MAQLGSTKVFGDLQVTGQATIGTITSGVWNGTAIPVANGGTGATSAAAALTNLGALPLAGGTMTGKLNGYAVNSPMSADSTASIEVRNISGATGDTGMAMLAFHAQGTYAIKMGVRSDGYFGLGGWSRGNWSWYSDPSGNMTAAGNITAYSDPRLKENFKKIENPIEKVKSLNGGTFNWKNGYEHTSIKAGKKDYGILANEVEAIMPELITESIEIKGERYKTVDYSKIIPLLIEAIKEQQTQIEELKALVGK